MIKDRLYNTNSYDLYISLGYGCPASRILRKCNLQFTSFPFDWIYGPNIMERVNIIANDFQDFLAFDSLEFYSQITGHDCYRNQINGIGFPHDFKLNTPLEESYPEVYEKYKRRIKRLIKMIEASKKVCFVYVTAGSDYSQLDEQELIKAQKTIQNRFPKTQIDILYFENSNSDNTNDCIVISRNIKKYIFNHSSIDKNTPWEVDETKIKHILKNYKITLKHLTFRNILQKYKIFSITHYQGIQKIKILGIRIKRRMHA